MHRRAHDHSIGFVQQLYGLVDQVVRKEAVAGFGTAATSGSWLNRAVAYMQFLASYAFAFQFFSNFTQSSVGAAILMRTAVDE